ncbi:hypothetical protein D3C81_1974660 [compost metagenome]
MNQCHQAAPGRLQGQQLVVANAVVADRHHHTMELVEAIEQRLGIAGHRPGAIALALRPGIVEKLHGRPATALGGIRYHLAVPAGTENGQTLHVLTHR